MKKLWIVLILLLCSRRAISQGAGYTQVFGTGKTCYANGSVQATFLNQSTTPQLPLLNGSTFPTTAVTNFDSSGAFSFYLADNQQIFPTPSQWTITACAHSGAQPACGTTTITATGPTTDITPALTAMSCPSSGGTVPGSTGDVFFNQSGGLAVDHGRFTYNSTSDALTVPVANGVANPIVSLDNTCGKDVHLALQLAINTSGVDFYVPAGCYNLGSDSVGITIPTTIARFIMSPGAQFQYSGTGTCVAINGISAGGVTSHYRMDVNCVKPNPNWIPQGIMTSATYVGGLTVTSGTAGTCPLTNFNNGSSGAQATLTISGGVPTTISFFATSVAGNQGGIHATSPPTTATVGTCTNGVTVSGTLALTSVLNSNFTTPEDTTSTGIICTACASYDIYVSARGFANGFVLNSTAVTGGVAENRIYPGNLQDNFISYTHQVIGGGFTNQNDIYHGQMRINSSSCPGGLPVQGSTLVLLLGGSDNANIFHGTELEGQCNQYSVHSVHGAANIFLGVRFEAGLAGSILFEPGSNGNMIIYPQGLPGANYSPTIVDNGTGNQFYGLGWVQDFGAPIPMSFTDSQSVPAATYVGGLTPTGADGTTCILTFVVGSPSATGTVAMLGGVIPTNSPVTMTKFGQQYGSAPTTATATNGTATNCAGTANVIAPLGKAPVFQFAKGNSVLTVGAVTAPPNNGGTNTGSVNTANVNAGIQLTTPLLKLVPPAPSGFGNPLTITTDSANGININTANGGNLAFRMLLTGHLQFGLANGSGFGFQTSGAPTATRILTFPNANSATVVTGTFTTTAATSDSVVLQGCTTSSRPWVFATNAVAAGLTGVYVTAPVANGFTLNHPATAGGTFYTYCTP